MIEALLFYLVSIGVSSILDRINYKRVLYEVNKQGTYVIPELFNVAYRVTYETSFLEMLIPIYNLLKPMYKGLNIPNTFETFYDVLQEADLLEVMEPEREKELEENPTISKSQELTKKHEKEIRDYSRVIFSDYSIAYFDVNDKSFSRIKRVIGPISHDDVITQYNRINHAIELYRAFTEVLFKDKLTEEEMEAFLNTQFNFDLTEIDENISVEEFRQGAIKSMEEAEVVKRSEKNAKTLKRILKK